MKIRIRVGVAHLIAVAAATVSVCYLIMFASTDNNSFEP